MFQCEPFCWILMLCFDYFLFQVAVDEFACFSLYHICFHVVWLLQYREFMCMIHRYCLHGQSKGVPLFHSCYHYCWMHGFLQLVSMYSLHLHFLH